MNNISVAEAELDSSRLHRFPTGALRERGFSPGQGGRNAEEDWEPLRRTIVVTLYIALSGH